MTQQEFINSLSYQLDITDEKVSEVLDLIFEVISNELLANGVVSLEGFGIFETVKKSEYISLKSITGERFLMPPEIEVVFESEEFNNKSVELNDEYNSLSFEPDELLRNNINNAFINFEPTLLNEGVEIPGIQVISDVPDIIEEDSQEDITQEDFVPEEVVLHINQSTAIKDSPPNKHRNSTRKIFIPVMGGVAIALAALFFFNTTTDRRNR